MSIFTSLFLALGMSQAASPITLDVTPSATGVQLRVVGRAAEPVEARYTLEVEGANGNRSRQSGRARLGPERDSVLLVLNLGGAQRTGEARLTVETKGGQSFVQTMRLAEIGG